MAAVSKKEDEFIRLQMLIDLGTTCLRQRFDQLIKPEQLENKLKINKSSIIHNISSQEKKRLYPPEGGSVTSDDLDLTALVRVLKNTVLDEPLTGYGKFPKDGATSFTDDVIRLVLTRNKLEHTGYRKLKDHECENISHTLKEVIKRIGEPGCHDKLIQITSGSLDYRADSVIWHVRETMGLLSNALNENVLQPTKASVIKLNKQQPLPYSILGGAGLSYGMENNSVAISHGEINYYLSVLQSFTVRQGIFVLNKHPFFKQKLAELILYQGNQNNSPNDIKHVDVEIVDVSATKTTLTSDVLGLHSQHGNVNHVCKKHTIRYYRLLDSNNSTIKVECCNFCGLNTKNNFEATCQMNLQQIQSVVSTSSSNNTVLNCAQYIMNDVSSRAEHFERVSHRYNSKQYLSRVNTCNLRYNGRTNAYRSNTCHRLGHCPNACRPNGYRPNARQSDLNVKDRCVIQSGTNIEHVEKRRENIEHVEEKRKNIKHVEERREGIDRENQNAPMIVKESMSQIAVTLCFVLNATFIYVYPALRDYFKSRCIAAILTMLIVIVELLLVYFYFKE